VETMRVANIAHLLAISGLHMGLLTGFVYGALRVILAMVPALALQYPIRKWAAAGALVIGAFYLMLSGGNVATERAFIQVAVMLTAVMLDRRAITLRSVAIAAVIVLLHRPETLFSPGFQMSFAATAALVAVFNGLRGATWLSARPGWQKWVFALVLSSVVAGLATAPFAAAHFNRIAVFGLVANLLTVPVMGSVIIPAAVVAALLWPLGLSGPVFAVMEIGLTWILDVAARVASWPFAVDYVPSPPPGTLGLVAIGGLIAILWRGQGRWAGVLPLVLPAFLWSGVNRPDVLISDGGRLVGVMTEEGRALSRARGEGFVAGVWLENDGDGADQAAAAARLGWATNGRGVSMEHYDVRIWHGTGRRALDEADAACHTHDVIILSEAASEVDGWLNVAPPSLSLSPFQIDYISARRSQGAGGAEGRPCAVIDLGLLTQTGALALWLENGQLTAMSASAEQGGRLWTR